MTSSFWEKHIYWQTEDVLQPPPTEKKRWSRKQVIAFSCIYETDSPFLCFCLCDRSMKDICPAGSFIHRVRSSGVSTTLMTACNCPITHTNVHSGPLFPAKKMHFHCGPGCQPPGVTANSVEPLRKNNVIFIRGDMGCPPHYHSSPEWNRLSPLP